MEDNEEGQYDLDTHTQMCDLGTHLLMINPFGQDTYVRNVTSLLKSLSKLSIVLQ